MRWLLTAVLTLGSSLAIFGGVAVADHCTDPLGHLSNDECGYWVEVVPTPAPTEPPEPTDVRVVNGQPLDVHITDDPVPVAEQSPQPVPTPSGDGVSVDDSLLVAGIAEQLTHTRVLLVWLGALALVALGCILVFVIPRIR